MSGQNDSKPPIAFLSYAHRDDQQTAGKITELREALQLAVSSVVGEDFEIFQDSDAIAWGKQWQGRLDEALGQAQFLLAIITPSYFKSAPCRDELEKFVALERRATRSDLILPLYFRTIRDINTSQDQLVQLISRRQYRDWREVRNKPLEDPSIREKIDELADELGESIASSSATVQTPARFAESGPAPPPAAPALERGFDVAQLSELRARVDKLEEERTAREATITALQSARTTLEEELREARRHGSADPAQPDALRSRRRLLPAAYVLALGLAAGTGTWIALGPPQQVNVLEAEKLASQLQQRNNEIEALTSKIAEAEAVAAESRNQLEAEQQARQTEAGKLADQLRQRNGEIETLRSKVAEAEAATVELLQRDEIDRRASQELQRQQPQKRTSLPNLSGDCASQVNQLEHLLSQVTTVTEDRSYDILQIIYGARTLSESGDQEGCRKVVLELEELFKVILQ